MLGNKILFILLLSFTAILADNDLEVTDEKFPDEIVPQEEFSSYKRIDDDEEFDNPHLLNKQTNQMGFNPNLKSRQDIPTDIKPQQNYPQEIEKNFTLAIYEIIMIAFLLIFILNCFIGKRSNDKLCEKWYHTNKNFFEDNYAHIGVNTEYNTKNSVAILKESYNNFKFYASGRVFTNWMLVHMNFRKRQDLLSSLSSIFLFNDKDRIIYEASINPNMELPLVFCICKKKDIKHMKKSYSDINHFTKSYDPSYMASNLSLLSEDYEEFNDIFENKEYLNYYDKVEKYIDLIYLNDRQTFSKETYCLYISFDINDSVNEKVFSDMTHFVHLLIDLLCQKSKLSQRYRKEAEKLRTEYEKIRIKELQEKNSENVPKKLDKNIKSNKKQLTIEQAQKQEEKEKKDMLKSQKKKQFKVVKI